MTERTIARRYVRALFELSLEQGGADAVMADLARLLEALARAPAQLSTLLDPRADVAAKRAVVDAALGATARPLAQDFCRMLIDRKRERLLLLAAEEFASLLREQRGEAVAEVTSAAPLDAAAREALQAQLGQLTRKKVSLQEAIDATLLSGVRVRVGSMLLDGSARRRLAGMRDELMKVALPTAPETG
ncbi:MAG: ATP synthase F1 subunit delta [Planctomycetes bacterium]|nr:ATP synthase F1 subunit delta [Planctomycetota bacterium]